MTPILTERLELLPASPESIRAALAGQPALGKALQAVVPSSWPPQYLDRAAFEFTLARLVEDGGHAGWWIYFVILREASARVLIGSAGYKGPPSPDGSVELGYGIVADRQRQGFATEVVRGLLARAFEDPAIRRVIAETYPVLTPSIGVLEKCGFRCIGEGSEPGVIRYQRLREEWSL